MNSITIFSDNTISVGTTITGYRVQQTSGGTLVSAWHNQGHPRPNDMGDIVQMPQKTYALSTSDGRAAFDRDFLAKWALFELERKSAN